MSGPSTPYYKSSIRSEGDGDCDGKILFLSTQCGCMSLEEDRS